MYFSQNSPDLLTNSLLVTQATDDGKASCRSCTSTILSPSYCRQEQQQRQLILPSPSICAKLALLGRGKTTFIKSIDRKEKAAIKSFP